MKQSRRDEVSEEFPDVNEAHYQSWRLPDIDKWDGNTCTDHFTTSVTVKVTAHKNARNKDAGVAVVEILCNEGAIHHSWHRWKTAKQYEVFAESVDMLCGAVQEHLPLFLVVLGHQGVNIAKEVASEYRHPITLQEIGFKDAIQYSPPSPYLNVKVEDISANELAEGLATAAIMTMQTLPSGDFRVYDYRQGKVKTNVSAYYHLPSAHLEKHAPEMERQFDQLLELAKSIYRYKFIPPPIAKIPDAYKVTYPIVKNAQKEVRKLLRTHTNDWAERLLDDDRHSIFRLYKDLAYRLSGNREDITVKEIENIERQGASISAPKDIALEMAARMCGADEYQYSIKRLRQFQRGIFSMQTRVRKKPKNWK